MLHRRSFLKGLVSMFAAPAIVRAENIMPVRAIIIAPPVTPVMRGSLTGIIPTLYESLDIISRELIGAIPAVDRVRVDIRKIERGQRILAGEWLGSGYQDYIANKLAASTSER